MVREIAGKIWIYILLEIAVGAGAHGFLPDEYLAGALGNQNWYSSPWPYWWESPFIPMQQEL